MAKAKTQSINEEMSKIQDLKSEDTSLNDLLRQSEGQTQTELADVAQRSAYVKEYMEVNQELASKINTFLDKSQSHSEKFKALMQSPSKSTFGRMFRAISGSKTAFSPQKVSEVIMDMYTNMILQKDAVSKQLSIVENRREDLFSQSSNAVNDLEKADENFSKSSSEMGILKDAMNAVNALLENDGTVGDTKLEALKDYFQELDIKDGETPERVSLAKINILVDKLEKIVTESEETKKKYEIELNAANSAIKGYRVQKLQFNEYVRSVKVLLYGLETHLKYSKTHVENIAILAQAQETSIKAIEAFAEYQTAINDTMVLNSIGVQVMARQTAEVLNKDMFDEESLKEATDRAKEGKEYWDNFGQQYTSKAEELSAKIKASKEV